MKERIHYIDVAKGLLILFVVLGHYNNVCISKGVDNDVSYIVDWGDCIWGGFFMPAFFLLTGLCSNFNDDWKSFHKKQLLSIIFPAFNLGLISLWLGNFLSCSTIPHRWGGILFFAKMMVLNGGTYWFLSALFLVKISHYWLLRKNSIRGVFIIGIICFALGVIWNDLDLYSPWNVKYALLLMPFMTLGYHMKTNSIKLRRFWIYIAYILICLIEYYLFDRIPNISHGLYFSYRECLFVFFAAVFGSLMLLDISKIIGKSLILEYLGKHSLIIYTVHINIYLSIVGLFLPDLNYTLQGQVVTFIVSLISTISICLLLANFLNSKYLKILIGRF